MSFSQDTVNGILIIKPTFPRLDAKDAPKFKEDVIKMIKTLTNHKLVIDLDAVNFIDSSGIGSLLAVLRELNPVKGELKLSCVKPPILRVFELVSMHRIFEIYKTTNDAVSSFTNPSKDKVTK